MTLQQRPPSILVVDDTVENLTLLAELLSADGYDVRPVTNGPEALEAIASDLPDLVLLDVTMPDMNGFEVCEAIKANEAWRDIPVIFLTALTDVSDKLRGFAAGGTDYVTKPFHFGEVRSRVNAQVALVRAKWEIAEQLRRLRELEQLRDDLVHMIVHDMRTPLTVLLMNLAEMREAMQGDAAEIADSATRSADGLKRMADALLDVSRLEAGKMPLNRETCDLGAIATGVRNTMVAIDPERVITVDASSPASVMCDQSLIHRVVENLVSNGIKHTPSGTGVHIRIIVREGIARCSIEDAGSGVPVDAREKIFEKFGVLQGRANRTYHSAGLGLAFCKLAVVAHGGTIGVDALEPRGSAFWFELPA